MRLILLAYLPFFLLVNLICTQAFAAPSVTPAISKTSKTVSSPKEAAIRPSSSNDGSAAGYRLLEKVKKENIRKYSIRKLNTSSKMQKKKR